MRRTRRHYFDVNLAGRAPQTEAQRQASSLPLLPLLTTLASAAPSAPEAPGWQFSVKGNSGIVALEAVVVSPTLVLLFDRAQNDPLQIDGHPAWGGLWNLEHNNITALEVVTNSWCASGAILSNGTMVSPTSIPASHGHLCVR